MKRPQSAEAKISMEQNVGRLPRKIMKRPDPEDLASMRVKGIEKANKRRPGAALAPAEKRLRSLNKLLRDIEELQRREDAGEDLDEAQQAKLARLDAVLEEMEELMAGGGGGGE